MYNEFRRTEAGCESPSKTASRFWWSSDWETKIRRRTENESCRTPWTEVSLKSLIEKSMKGKNFLFKSKAFVSKIYFPKRFSQ